jgi:polysaccharide export outer membrane protein
MRILFIGLVAVLALSACASAQVPSASPPTPARSSPAAMVAATPPVPAPAPAPAAERPDAGRSATPVDVGTLTLGAGDLLEVSVFDVPELSGLKTRVSSTGAITLPLLGAVSAAGLTAGELQSVIRLRLQDRYMHDPQVSVFITEHKSQRIFVSGAVRSPGAHELVGRLRLADALAMAGGVTDDAGRSVQVTRKRPEDPAGTGSVAVIDLDKVATANDEANVELQAGDVIDVARAGAFYVGGEVNRPGSFFLKARTTVAQAVVGAGGVKDVADWDDVRLYRRRADGSPEVQTFSLNEFESGTPAPEVQADDVVVVGKSGMKVFLYGLREFFKFGIGASLPII